MNQGKQVTTREAVTKEEGLSRCDLRRKRRIQDWFEKKRTNYRISRYGEEIKITGSSKKMILQDKPLLIEGDDNQFFFVQLKEWATSTNLLGIIHGIEI